MTPRGNLHNLTPNIRQLLHGDNWDRYGDNAHILAAILMGLHNAGFDEHSAITYLRRSRESGARRLLTEFQSNFEEDALRTWNAIQAKDLAHADAVDAWVMHLNATFNVPRGGATFRVALALACIAYEAGDLTFTASVRQITEVAGVGAATDSGASHKTTRRALTRLRKGGWIRSEQSTHHTRTHQHTLLHSQNHENPITPREISNGATSRIDSPKVRQSSSSAATGRVPYIVGRFSINDALSEVFSPVALEMNAFRAMTCIRNYGPLSAAELAHTSGMPRSSTDRAILKLSQQQMIYASTDGRWNWTGLTLEFVEQALGLTQRPLLRQQAFRRERHNYRNRLARHPINNPQNRHTTN